MSMLAELVEVVIGVDTHTDTHTAAVVTAATGAVLAVRTVPADSAGYAQLIALADEFTTELTTEFTTELTGEQDRERGALRAWAIEGTGGYGAGLARYLAEAGEFIVELDRPARPARRAGAKSDPIDAERAARDALSRTRLAQPKTGPQRAALQTLLAVRRAAVEAALVGQRQLHALVVTAPEPVRTRFRGQATPAMLATAARLRLHGDIHTRTTITTLRALARRVAALHAEAADHEKAIRAIVRSWRPDLLERHGVGPINAAVVLSAWSHPGRCRNDAAFAMLAGAAPIPASSGRTVRHRLNRSGDRQLNRALHNIALCRMRYDPATRAYTERRRAEGRSDREIRRCLKRYIARQLYRQLESAGRP